MNIRVNCICTGTIDTPLLHKAVDLYVGLTSTKKGDVYRDLDKIQPLEELANPRNRKCRDIFIIR